MAKLPERMKHIQKINAIMNLIKEGVGKMSVTESYIALCHINWFMKRKVVTPLTGKEKTIYDLFMRESINPKTAYNWFGFFRLSKDLQNDVKHNKTTFRQAKILQKARRKETKKGLEKEILGDIMKTIGMLKDASTVGEVI